MNDGTNPLTWDAQLFSYWFSRNPAVFQDSVLWHQEVGRAKDLSAPPCKVLCYWKYMYFYTLFHHTNQILCPSIKNIAHRLIQWLENSRNYLRIPFLTGA
jgi:hypothetical protein